MEYIDLRKLNSGELKQVRRQVVRLKKMGKTVRMNGLYYAGYYEPTGQYYHYCIIQDALACCAQGLEFVWDDGSHIYPDEYPAEETEIVVQGIFDLYQEEGDEMLYCRLKDAVMQVKGGE